MKKNNKISIFVFFCIMFILLLSTASYATIIIDQNQPNGPSHMGRFYQTDLAQSFQQANDNVAGAGIWLYTFGSSGPVTISLWDALPNDGGLMLATGTSVGIADNWVDVFWSPISVVPDTELFLVFTPSDNGLGIRGDPSNPYPRGQVYANPGFGSYPSYDYAFRTYYDDNSVPEPATLLLLGSGLVGLGLFRKKFRKK